MIDIYNLYLETYPNTISVIAIDHSDEDFMNRLIKMMENALKTDIPLDDSIFGIPDDALI